MPCFKDNKCILNTSINTQCIVLLVIHSVSFMLSIFLYKMVTILNGINTKHKSAEKNTGQCFLIELQFTCQNLDKCEQNRKIVRMIEVRIIEVRLYMYFLVKYKKLTTDDSLSQNNNYCYHCKTSTCSHSND